MCRLLGYVTREPVTVNNVLQGTLTALKEASHFHGDGWGFSWYTKDGQLQLVKSPEAAHTSENFTYEAEHIHTDSFISHLRWATEGFSICMDNTHPFIRGQFAFAHNGLILPREEIEELIAPGLRPEIKGTTDSERYFLALLTAIEEMGSIVEGTQSLLETIFTYLQPSGANYLFLTPDTLYAVCAFNPTSEQAHKEPDYYPLQYRITDNAVIIGSTGLGQDDNWTNLANGQILLVKRGTLEVTIVDLISRTNIALQGQYQPL